MPRNCWTRCNKTFPCSFPAREKTREIESRETSRCLEKQAILALLRKMIYKTEFAREVGISSNTLAKLSKNELVSLEVLVRICRQLDCSLGDVVQLAPPEPPIKSGLERMKKRRPTHEKGGNAYRHE